MKLNNLIYKITLNITCKAAVCLLILASFSTNYSMEPKQGRGRDSSRQTTKHRKPTAHEARIATLRAILADPLTSYNSHPTAALPAVRDPKTAAPDIAKYQRYLELKYASKLPDERV